MPHDDIDLTMNKNDLMVNDEVSRPTSDSRRAWSFGKTLEFERSLDRAIQLIADADTLVVGAGAGLSLACGEEFAYDGERFSSIFPDFEAAYGIHNMYAGEFLRFPTMNEYWAYWSRLIVSARYDCPVGEAYRDLKDVVLACGRGDELEDKKDYFVVTSNVDHQFQRVGFDKEHLFYMQGDYGLWQCSHRCAPMTYDNEEYARAQAENQKDRRVPPELVPNCPMCGARMCMNLHTTSAFVKDGGWLRARDRYHEFLIGHQTGKVVFLELGVGNNTPGIIKRPFWKMTNKNEDAAYIQINQGQSIAPAALGDRAILLNGDAAGAIRKMKEELYS